MEATTIAHLTGQMEAILEILEFRIQQIKMEDYQAKCLMEQINKAKAVNDEIFEMHKKNELNGIKKIYNDLSNENKQIEIRAQRESDVLSCNSDRHLFCSMGDNRIIDNLNKNIMGTIAESQKVKLINIPIIDESGYYIIDTNEKQDEIEWDASREFKVDVYPMYGHVEQDTGYRELLSLDVSVELALGERNEEAYRLEEQLRDLIYEQWRDY